MDQPPQRQPDASNPRRVCPMCREAAGWRNPPAFDSVTLVFDDSKERLRTFAMVCENCGFVRLHDASKITWG